jgi:acetyl-CoA/propionyl-CoA carboxylase, biotin carboxylase, biotin carboxyl carrier protein
MSNDTAPAPLFSKVLVANRGEIAVRIIQTCADLGIATVAVYSEADENAKHVRLADEAVCIGATAASESYLNVDRILDAARQTGAQAIHPGYGFLAENAGFSRAVAAAGLVFIGPSGDAIEVMGEKVAARECARAAGVPQVPGSAGAISSPAEVLAFGEEFGYPIAIKAAYGGGGRGMRLVHEAASAVEAFDSAQREALAAFGHADVYLERYLSNSRHVEVQLFADTLGNAVWLGDRDCSIQRRHQKLVEESPAPGLSAEMRRAMGEASVRLAKAVGYVGAGTVEFLVEGDAFYFLEMNTRIQVEHPVTEAVLGLDLVIEQLRVAAGLALTVAESGPDPRGHAIEVRLNAEDVAEGRFVPSPGTLSALQIAQHTGVRFDGGYDAGDEVLPFYDSLIGKIICWAPTREQAIDRMLRALADSVVSGVPTTIPAAKIVLAHPDFRSAAISTRWLEDEVAGGLLNGLEPWSAVDGEADEADAANVVWVGDREYVIPFFGATSDVGQPVQATEAVTRGPSRGASAPRKRAGGPGSGAVTSPMQGTVVKVLVELGDLVEKGALLFVLDAMKMENPVKAAIDGIVSEIHAVAGDVVAAGAALARIVGEGSESKG